jgi:hypothetical protein
MRLRLIGISTTAAVAALVIPTADLAAASSRPSAPVVGAAVLPAPLPPGVPAVPPSSGFGRRIVYDMGAMRVWLVESDGSVARSYRVSGHKSLRQPGTGEFWVYSRSRHTNHRENTALRWEFMVRFAIGTGEGLPIGFHSIPVEGGQPIMSEEQLGRPLSSGCVRQSRADAEALWNWSNIGTKVVVIDTVGKVPVAPAGAYPPGARPPEPIDPASRVAFGV